MENIQSLSIKGLDEEITNLNDKYNIYISSSYYKQRLLNSFIEYWKSLNLGLKVDLNDKDLKKCETYKEVEKVLNAKYPNIKNLRVEQLLFNFRYELLNRKKLKYFSYHNLKEEYTEEDLKSEFLRITQKSLFLDIWGLSSNYDKMENINKLLELFKILFDLNILITDVYNSPLNIIEKGINEQQSEIKIKFYLNGKVVLTFKDKEKHKILSDLLFKKLLEIYKKLN